MLAMVMPVAVIGTAFRIESGDATVAIGDVIILPLLLGFGRLTYHAAIYAKSPRDGDHWPFASPRVAGTYLIFLAAYHLIRP